MSQAHGGAVHAERGQRHPDLGMLPGHTFEHFPQVRVVGGRERREGKLLVAARRKLLGGHAHDLIGGPLPDRPVPHAGLAETAAPRAAAHDLDPRPVVHARGERHQTRGGVRGALQPRGDAPRHPEADAGHVHAFDLAQPLLQFRARHAGALRLKGHLEHLGQDDLAVTDDERVEERLQRHEVGASRAAADHERSILRPLRRAHGQSGQVEQLEDVGVVELVLQRDAEQVGRGHGSPRLDGEQRHRFAAHGVDGVDPGQVGALHPHARRLARQVVEDLQGLVGDADLVRVGEGHDDPQLPRSAPAETRAPPRVPRLCIEPVAGPRRGCSRSAAGSRARRRARAPMRTLNAATNRPTT